MPNSTCADCRTPILLALCAYRPLESGRTELLHLACAAADPAHPFGSDAETAVYDADPTGRHESEARYL